MDGPAADLPYRTLTEVADAIVRRAVSPVELTDLILARIERFDPALRSYLRVTGDLARTQARDAEREIMAGRYRGPLHGVPVAVKDLCFTKDIPTSAGMAIHRERRPDYDATVVVRLREAGAVLLGKLHMTEGAMQDHHPELGLPPVNPWGTRLWPGVSSSGCGVATAAGLCFGSIGSDSGGSIRIPSACNALTGLKPTWGRVSRYGIFPLAETRDVVGPMVRCAADAAAMMWVIAGPDDHDPTTIEVPVPDYRAELGNRAILRRMRVGIDDAFNSEGLDPEVERLVGAAIRELGSLGLREQAVKMPDPGSFMRRYGAFAGMEIVLSHRDTFPSRAEHYGPWLRQRLAIAASAAAADVAAGMVAREQLKSEFARLFNRVDIIVTPVLKWGTPTWAEIETLAGDEFAAVTRFTLLVSVAGLPSIVLPCGWTADGRPVAMQIIGAPLAEGRLLTLAHAYQSATGWHLRHPVLS